MLNVFELQKELVKVALPSGREERQAELLASLAKPYVDEVYTDMLGNVICHKKGSGKKIMMPAHMDVIGFMAMYIDKRGFIRFNAIGGHTASMLVSVPVVFENGVHGCIRATSKSSIMEKSVAGAFIDDLYIDIGARDEEEAKSMIKVGDVATFDYEPVMLAGGNMMTPYADNLASCIALLIAMENLQETNNDLYFVFSTQEEVGCRGGQTAAQHIAPDMGIAVDLTRTGDTPGDVERMVVSVGKGPAIKIKDSLTLCNPQVIAHLRAAAKKGKIKYQDEILLRGATDASAMQRSLGGVLSGCISIPGRNIHSAAEIINIKDVENAGKLLALAAAMEF